jgi:hypothetical protein
MNNKTIKKKEINFHFLLKKKKEMVLPNESEDSALSTRLWVPPEASVTSTCV